jgi:hypothetical protein
MSACLPASARASRAGRAGARNRPVARNARNAPLRPGTRLEQTVREASATPVGTTQVFENLERYVTCLTKPTNPDVAAGEERCTFPVIEP